MGLAGALRRRLRAAAYVARHARDRWWVCPICRHVGPFAAAGGPEHPRPHATCPSCGAAERHRLQWLVMRSLARRLGAERRSILHVAPDAALAPGLRRLFGRYESADIERADVDHRIDLTACALPDASYDCVFASHVLEHIRDDQAALRELRRLLRPGGVAVLAVPFVAITTVEYEAPCPEEHGHVRAPGFDYFERYERVFDRVQVVWSQDLPDRYQTYVHTDLRAWVRPDAPRAVMRGARHPDAVALCFR